MKDNKVYDFFFQPLEFEKTSETKVSQSSANWEEDILQKLSEEKPFVLEGTDFIIKFKEIDNERGYAFGSIVVVNKPEGADIMNAGGYNGYGPTATIEAPSNRDSAKHAFIPVIIKNRKLSDFDIFIVDGQPHSLSERNFYRHMYDHDTFSNALQSPGISRFDYDEMVEKQTPPYSSNRHQVFRSSGFLSLASAGMSKQASGIDSTRIVDQVIPTVYPKHRERLQKFVGDEHNMAQFAGTPALETVDRILKGSPLDTKDKMEAFKDGLPPNVLRFRAMPGDRYMVFCVSDWVYAPVVKDMHLDEVLAKYKDLVPNLAELLTSRKYGGDFVVGVDHKDQGLIVLEDYDTNPEYLQGHKSAVVLSDAGDALKGYFCDNVYDPNGKKAEADLFFNGDCFAYQNSIVGEPVEGEFDLKEGSLSKGTWGTFAYLREGGLATLRPFRVLSVTIRDGKAYIRAQDLYARNITYVITPGVEKIVNLTNNQSLEIGSEWNGNAYAIPKNFKFIHLGSRVTLIDDPVEMQRKIDRKLVVHGLPGEMKKDMLLGFDSRLPHTVNIKYSDGNYSMSGEVLVPITKADTPVYLNPAEALYYLVILGASVSSAARILDRARELENITVSNCKDLNVGVTKLSTAKKLEKMFDEACSELNKDLLKEAAEISMATLRYPHEKTAGDLTKEDSVDVILSLSFINPENLSTYLANLERLEQAEDDLAQLLLLVRLGLDNVNETAVVNAMRNLSEVNEDLRFLNHLIEAKKVQR